MTAPRTTEHTAAALANAVVLPDPQEASLPTLVRACDQLTHLLRTDPPDDIDVCREWLDRLSAIETYLSKRDHAWAAMTPARLLEARIGELLGARRQGERTDLSGATDKLTKDQRVEFRRLAEYRHSWEHALPLSRRAALTMVEHVRHPASGAPELGVGRRYGLVYADPPWAYPSEVADRARTRHYPAMTIEDIESMPVAEICAPDALLYLWATAPLIFQAGRVLEAWGFEYLTQIVWDKGRAGLGYWARNQHDILLIGRRGEWSPPAKDLRPSSVIRAPRTTHSAKPAVFAEMIEETWPGVPRIELFRRGPARPGWDVVGDEAVVRTEAPA